MSELISGKEAKLAWAKGKSVQYYVTTSESVYWESVSGSSTLSIFDNTYVKFRLEPRTITINGVEVPAPFEPEIGDRYWHIYSANDCGYHEAEYEHDMYDKKNTQFGAWRTEEEIKQVVEVLRSVFK